MQKILYKLLAAAATNPGAGAAAAAATGSPSLQVEHSDTRPAIVAWWASPVATGFHQLAPQSGHDTVRGLRIGTLAGEQKSLLRKGRLLSVLPQENLAYTIAGSAGAVEYGCLLMAYPDHAAGTDAFLNYAQLNERAEKATTVNCTLDTIAEGFSGAELLTAESDLLLANRRYAICGMTTTVERAALTLTGPDFGNVTIGMPGDSTNPERASEWFVDMSRTTGLPMIPTFHTGNLRNTFVGCVGRAADADANVTLYLELLKGV